MRREDSGCAFHALIHHAGEGEVGEAWEHAGEAQSHAHWQAGPHFAFGLSQAGDDGVGDARGGLHEAFGRFAEQLCAAAFDFFEEFGFGAYGMHAADEDAGAAKFVASCACEVILHGFAGAVGRVHGKADLREATAAPEDVAIAGFGHVGERGADDVDAAPEVGFEHRADFFVGLREERLLDAVAGVCEDAVD